MTTNLTKIQQEIVDISGNLVVSSSAGTGKTHTLVAKISKEIEENKDHRVIAAITFTIKASKEIRDRLSLNFGNSFIGTNNSFAIEEVIVPFMKDAFGDIYDCPMSTDYETSFSNFNEGLRYISNEGTLGVYNDTKKNFVFELALKVLKESEVARLYLKAKYFKIYIDEYQDCDLTMNEFFMYLTDTLQIDLFIVGDYKQSLYIWRGATPQAFQNLFAKKTFQYISMRDNFRSNKQIQNFSNLLFEETSNLYEIQGKLNNILLLNCNDNNWIQKIYNVWDKNKNSALLRARNNDAENCAKLLFEYGMEFKFIPKPPIDEISNDTAWIYYSIAQYIFLDSYSIYDFIYDIPSGTTQDYKLKNKILYCLKEITKNIGIKTKFEQSVVNLVSLLSYEAQSNDMNRLYETLLNKENIDFFEQDKFDHRAMTCHGSKGLQFEQIIIFLEDFNFSRSEELYKYYVAVTRAKNKLFIILTDTWASKQNLKKLRCIFNDRNIELEDLVTID